MTKCVLCGKDRAENEMRPLINIDELAVGNMLSEADEQAGVEAEREVGGAMLQVVCRSCWHAILESKEKGDVIEMLETLCGLLFEVERRRKSEQARQPRGTLSPTPGWGGVGAGPTSIPCSPGGVVPLTFPPHVGHPVNDPSIIEKSRGSRWTPGMTGQGTQQQKWTVGGTTAHNMNNISLTAGTVTSLGNQWDSSFGTSNGNQ